MTTDEQAIRDLVATWHRATAAGDVDSVLALMTDDVVFLVGGREPLRGRSSVVRIRGQTRQSSSPNRSIRDYPI